MIASNYQLTLEGVLYEKGEIVWKNFLDVKEKKEKQEHEL